MKQILNVVLEKSIEQSEQATEHPLPRLEQNFTSTSLTKEKA
jgi:hypothetical protein